MKKITLLLFALFAFSFNLFAQPANDDCANAVALTVNADLACGTVTSGTTNAATASSQADDVTGTPNTDVWFTFVATGAQHTIVISNIVNQGGGTSTSTDMGMGVYDGTSGCGTLVFTDDSDPNTLALSGLTIGTTYYVRVYGWLTSVQYNNFDICIGTPPPPPANDDCSGAISYTGAYTMFAEGACTGTPNSLDLLSSTDDLGNDNPSCDTFAPNNGVWYTWTATSTGLIFDSGTGLPGLAVYEAGTCGSLVQVACLNNVDGQVTGLTIGNNYIFYIWDDTLNTTVTFCLEEFAPPPPPANDDCSGAISYTGAYTMFAEGACTGTPNMIDLSSATDDIGSDNPSCDTFANFGVWYTWTATSTGLTFDSGTGLPGLAVYEAGTCGSLVQVACLNNVDGQVTGLTIGNNYMIHIWDDTAGNSVTFCLEELTPSPPPANDDCANAVALTVNADLACGSFASGTLVSATASVDTEACSGTFDDDVWYSFVATATTHAIQVNNLAGSYTDLVFQLAEGTCGALTELDCHDTPNSGWSPTGLVIGNTYLIRVATWTATTGQTTTFDICVGTLPPPPANDDCANAIAISESTDLACNNAISGTTASATNSTDYSTGCSTTYNEVWYTFTPTTTQGYNLSRTLTFGTSSTYLSIWTGSCGSLTKLNSSCFSTSLSETLTSGTTYYISVATFNSGFVDFDLCIFPDPPPPANDDCVNAISLTPGNIYSTNPLDGNVHSATADTEPNGCGSNGPGIWYSFVAPADGNITIETGPDSITSNTGFDSLIEAFSGTCGSLVSIDCDDDGAPTNLFSLLNLTGLNAGETIYIRVWESGGNEVEPFSISAYSATLGVGSFENENAFTYFPNPVKGTLFLKAKMNIQNVSVYNILGQEVLRNAPNNFEESVDMSALQIGAYFVKVTIDNTTETIRIIKQ